MWYVVVGDRVIPVPCERDEDANFLKEDWWENATPKDVEAETKKGADVNAVSYDENGIEINKNPLYYAVETAELNALGSAEQKKITEANINILIKHGANVNNLKGYALYSLWMDCNLNILDILINAGLDVNQHITNYDNETLLSLATRKEQKMVVQRLLDAGAER